MKTKEQVSLKFIETIEERNHINTPGVSRLYGTERHNKLVALEAQTEILKWILDDD